MTTLEIGFFPFFFPQDVTSKVNFMVSIYKIAANDFPI